MEKQSKAEAMELYIARQPIFDSNKSVAGYELLHRESLSRNEYLESDGESASSRVISTAFLTLGLERLTSGKLAFVNFTGELIKSGVASLLPKDQLVVEVLETVAPTRDVVAACVQLKKEGYRLALDDYVLNPVFGELAELADIIKVDFRQASANEQRRIPIVHSGREFLAEKVETEEEFSRASDLGYSLFQGFFFSRPVILSTNTLLAGELGSIRLMQAVNRESPDFNMITSAIESDVTLSLETIRLANSAYFGRSRTISSIRQAVVALGIEGVRKWIYLSTLRRLGTGKPDILVTTSIIRSKFMELIATAVGNTARSPEYSMLGLFSLLDAICSVPFSTLLSELNITEEIKDVLTTRQRNSPLGMAYHTMQAYEKGKWEHAAIAAGKLGMTLDAVAMAYIDALHWYNEFMLISAV